MEFTPPPPQHITLFFTQTLWQSAKGEKSVSNIYNSFSQTHLPDISWDTDKRRVVMQPEQTGACPLSQNKQVIGHEAS